MYKYYFHFLFRFLLETKKTNPPSLAPLCPPFWGGSSAASPLEIRDVMPPYLKRLFSKKQKIDNFDHFCLDDPLRENENAQICSNKMKIHKFD